MADDPHTQRKTLIAQIEALADVAIFGSTSESYRKCGNKNCRCHKGGPKHGPHLYVSYRGAKGKTTGYYVPKAAQEDIRRGIDAWHELQDQLRAIAEINKELALQKARAK